ncbi:MAG TPA: AraC family transcriptional regulator [Puia sp.]|jgi:AraC-like DNA-binding protein|nr:AraC family transcriptional regulator [Puia sp.]
MYQAPDILMMAYKQPVMQDELALLDERERHIPGSVQYTIKRYDRHPQWSLDDMGMMIYHYKKDDPGQNYLELRFCIAGNVYCRKKEIECNACKLNASPGCSERIDTVDVLSFRFLAVHLSQFGKPRKLDNTLSDDILNFKHISSFSKILSLCGRTRMVLETLLNHSYTDSLENIFINAQSQMLLLYSLECMLGEKEVEGFQCKFLANESDREKIIKAREVLLQHIGEPLTIKELSRKVAINECYLKKGFKEMFGTTIFDFYQSQRMEHARYLLYEKGLSVTEVSVMLGYSSISHFSTAFKKHTGLKPCELLLH